MHFAQKFSLNFGQSPKSAILNGKIPKIFGTFVQRGILGKNSKILWSCYERPLTHFRPTILANCPYTLRRVLVRNGYFITDPDEPVLPHFCVGKLELPTIPKSKVQSHFFKTAQKQKKSKPKPKPKVVLTDPIVASDQADPHPTMFDVSLSPPNPKPTSSSPKPNPGAVKDFGPGRFKEIKKNIYLVYESAKFDSHEFKFKKCGSLANGTSIFECAKCRILKLRNSKGLNKGTRRDWTVRE